MFYIKSSLTFGIESNNNQSNIFLMSYSLYYQKQFIKLENNPLGVKDTLYLPFVEVGSSNCFDWDNKRARDWQVFSYVTENIFATQKEMEEKMNIERDRYINDTDGYTDAQFGWYAGIAVGNKHTSKTTWGNWVGIVKTGCRKALSFDQLSEIRSSVSLKFEYKGTKDLGENIERQHRIETEQDFWTFYTTYRDLAENKDFKFSMSFHTDYGDNHTKIINSRFFPRKAAAKVYKPFILTLHDEKGMKLGYFSKFTARSVHHSSTFKNRRYATLKQAQKVIDAGNARLWDGMYLSYEKE